MSGTSGNAGRRCALLTPSALSLPAWICALTLPIAANISCTWPASRSCTAGDVPWYGMFTMSTPDCILNASPAMCNDEPSAPMAMLSWPGLALGSAINSRMSLAGTEGWATRIDGEVATQVSAVKSLTGSNGSVGYSVALMAWLVKLISSMRPSGAARAMASAARLPPAPGLFSTITARPSAVPMLAANARASVSVEPPAGGPTRMRTGALAICASAPAGNARAAGGGGGGGATGGCADEDAHGRAVDLRVGAGGERQCGGCDEEVTAVHQQRSWLSNGS